jgi:hypothetical protein
MKLVFQQEILKELKRACPELVSGLHLILIFIRTSLIRSPISLERLSNDQRADITYHGKRDIYHFHPLTFLANLSLHIANHGEQACGEHSESMVRYYGWYSNKKRGMRKKQGMLGKPIVFHYDLTDYQKSCRKRWAALIRKIYESLS